MDLADGVVLILTPEGTAAGTGFVVSDTLLATCSHVVQPCMKQERGESRPETVNVVFHATGDTRETRVSTAATVAGEWWRGCEAEDIALLRVDQVPDRVKVLPLGSTDGVDQDEVYAFGYPETGDIEGLGGSGRVVRHVKESGRPLLQLRSNEITSGFSGGPLWDRQKRRTIGVVTSVLQPDRYGRGGETAFATPTEVLQAICPELQPSDICPYRRLSPFDVAHAEFFFGRDRLVGKLVSKLREDPRFLALLGPSGSGKSSVVCAGLIPRLAAGDLPGSREWGAVITRPGADPFAELARSAPFTGFAQSGLRDRWLAESFGQWMRALGHHRGVLVIDQFEELLVSTPALLRADFVAQLVDLLDSPLPITVVLVMRNDFYGRLDDSAPALLRWVEQGLLNVLPLDQDELAEIVAEPAKRVGLGFAEGLVEVILEEATALRAEGGAIPSTILPLVEFALSELWEQSHREGELTHQAYRALGGISGALTQWADGAYQGLDDQERPIARSIFLDLVHVADEEGVPDTRERKDLRSLCPAIEDRESVEKVVNMLAAKRLVITGEGRATVELIHDALIREWGPLHRWISEERPFRSWLQEMEPALRSWADYVRHNRSGEEPDWLRGQRLVQAERWLDNHGTELSRDLKELIKDSIRARDEEAERERRQLAIEQERQHAVRVSESLRLASEARQAIQAEPDTAFLVAWEAVLRDRNELTESVFRETLSQLPAPVKILRSPSQQWELSVGFANRGTLVFIAIIETGDVEIWNLGGTCVSRFTVPGSGVMTAASIPDLDTLLTWRDHVVRLHGADGTILYELPLTEERSPESIFLDLSLSVTQAGVCLVQVGGRGWVIGIDSVDSTLRLLHSLAFSSDDFEAPIHGFGARIFRAHLDRLAHTIITEGADAAGIWTLDGRLRAVLQCGAVAGADFLGDGRIVTGTQGGAGNLWDSDGGPLGEFKPANGGLDLFIHAISPDGKFFATTVNQSGVTEVWSSTGELRATLQGHEGNAWSGTFSADGRYLATGGEDRIVQVHDWRSGISLFELSGHQKTVNYVMFHPTNPAILLSAGHDGSVRLWTLEADIIRPLRGHGKGVDKITSTPVGILSSSLDGTSRVWRPDGSSTKLPGRLVSWRAMPGPQVMVVTADTSGTAYLSIVPSSGDSTQQGVVSGGTGDEEPDGIWSPDGSQLVLIQGDKANLYSKSGEHLCNLVGETRRDGRRKIIAGGFRRDGDAIFTAAENGTVWLWHSNGSPIGSFLAEIPAPPSFYERRPNAFRTEGTPDIIKSVGLDPRGQYILFGLRASVRFWTWDCNPEQQVVPPGNKVFQVAFMPDGAHIITVSDTASIGQDAFVRLWDRNGTLAASLNVPDAHPTTEVHCDPESRFFCLESSATIRIFDLRGQLLATLAAARGTHVVDMTIQSDGAQVAALFSDGRVRIWDLKSKRRTITLAVGDAARICFSSDSSRLLAASPSGLIEQYALNIEDLFPDAALRVNRELTAEEIDRFAIQKPVELDLDSYRRHP